MISDISGLHLIYIGSRAEHRIGGPGTLSCRTGRVFYFCPVLSPARTKVRSRTGHPVLIRAEHRTGGPGVLSYRTGRVFGFCPVLPPARTKVGSRTGQKILSCAHSFKIIRPTSNFENHKVFSN